MKVSKTAYDDAFRTLLNDCSELIAGGKVHASANAAYRGISSRLRVTTISA